MSEIVFQGGDHLEESNFGMSKPIFYLPNGLSHKLGIVKIHQWIYRVFPKVSDKLMAFSTRGDEWTGDPCKSGGRIGTRKF